MTVAAHMVGVQPLPAFPLASGAHQAIITACHRGCSMTQTYRSSRLIFSSHARISASCSS